jgi:hypothetical protein
VSAARTPAAAAEVEFSRPPWERVRAGDVDRWLPRIEALVASAGERASGSLASARAEAAATALVRGLAESDPQAVGRAAARLAGLGEGLTPAGDDFLAGALHALWARRGEGAEALAATVAAAAAPRTTTLSATWLASAARGQAAAPWRDLVAALASGREPAVEAALARVVSTGHTSGAASLAGFAATSKALAI